MALRIGFTIFVGCAVLLSALFILTEVTINSTLEQRDRDSLRMEFREAVRAYEEDGLAGLEELYPINGGHEQAYYVRLSTESGKTLFFHPPKGGEDFRVERLDTVRPVGASPDLEIWKELDHPSDADVLEVLSKVIGNGHQLQIGKNTDEREDLIEQLQLFFFAFGIPSLVFAMLGSIFISRKVVRPIQALIQAINEVGRREISSRVPIVNANDEIGSLTRLFNEMLERVENLLRGMRETVDNVAHDIRTPLTRLRGSAEMALKNDSDMHLYREALIQSVESAEHIITMVDTITDVSEAESGSMKLSFEDIPVSRLFEQTMDLYRIVAEDKGIKIEAHADSAYSIRADSRQMRRVMANLVDNAIKYSPPGSAVHLKATRGDRWTEISVADNGIGISADELSRIWDRLFRGDRSRSEKGLGLGLTLVKAIIEAHGGFVLAESKVAHGTRISLRFTD